MKIVLTLLLFIFWHVTTLAQSNSGKKYFEGVVEYDIKNESFIQELSANEIRERDGATLKAYFKNGDYTREYLDGAGYTLKKMFYRKNQNRIYIHLPMLAPDTLFYMSAKDTVYESFQITAGGNEKILNHDCPSTLIVAKFVSPHFTDTLSTTYTYFFCPELAVDPEWYKDFYIWSDVIKIHRSIAIKFIEDDPYLFKKTFTATKITWQLIDENFFKIDSNLVLKEMPKF